MPKNRRRSGFAPLRLEKRTKFIGDVIKLKVYQSVVSMEALENVTSRRFATIWPSAFRF